MNSTEMITVIEQIRRRFNRINKRFGDSPALLQDWVEALKGFSLREAEGGMRDWVWSHNSEPTLRALVDTIEKVKWKNKARNRPSGQGTDAADILMIASRKQASEADLEWATLHVKITERDIINRPSAANRSAMAKMYREMAEKLPHL